MRSLLSDRFSLESKEALPYLNQNQLKYVELVKKKIGNELILSANNCPCQKSSEESDVVIAEVDRYGLPITSVLCKVCGTVRIDPYLDDASLAKFYTEFYQDMYGRSVEVDEYFQRQKQYGEKFLSLSSGFLKPGSNVLEFGCGAGGALKVFQSKGCQLYGIEYSKKLIDHGKSKGIENLQYGSLEDFIAKFSDVRFDLIFSNHVFEHINKPVDYLRNCISLLKDEGSIICAVPDIYNIHKYEFPNSDLKMMLHVAHIYNYSFSCLETIAKSLQVKVERIYPDPMIITPTSSMPELWFKIQKTNVRNSENLVNGNAQKIDYLGYFRTTEENFLNGVNLIPQNTSLIKRVKKKLKQLIHWKR